MRQSPARSLVKGHEIVEILVSIHYLLCPPEDTVVQSVPPFHDSSSFHRGPPGPQGRGRGWGMTPASSDLISLERDADAYVTLSWPLPLPLCIPEYCSTEFPLTDEPGLRRLEEGSPPNKGLAYKLFTSPLSLHNGPRAPETPPATPTRLKQPKGCPGEELTVSIQIKANNWGSIQDSGATQVNSASTQWAY